MLKNPDTVVVTNRCRVSVPITATNDNPQISPDFSDTQASMRLIAHIAHDVETGKLDKAKHCLVTGTMKPLEYTSDSVIGQLVCRLRQRFGDCISVHVANDGLDGREPYLMGDLGIRVVMHPIPDGFTAANFGGAIRQSLRAIAREMAPRSVGRAA